MDPFNPQLFQQRNPTTLTPEQHTDSIIYVGAITGIAAAVTLAPLAAARGAYFVAGIGLKPGGGVGVSPLVAYYIILPPPFGFASPKSFGLEQNYFRTFFERLGVPGRLIPASTLFSTQLESPEVAASRREIAAHVQRNNYARLASGFTTEQLLSDYALFRGKQLGLINGPLIELPLRQLADAAAAELFSRGIDEAELNDALSVVFDNYTRSQKFKARHQAKGNKPQGVQTDGGTFGFIDSLFAKNPPDPR